MANHTRSGDFGSGVSDSARDTVESLLTAAGIRIDGPAPWDLQVHDQRFYARVLGGGSLAAGESYMDGWWDAARLDQFFERVFASGIEDRLRNPLRLALTWLRFGLLNPQSHRHAHEIGERHYDAGNDLFARMLDKRMVYSCGYWKDASDLDTAQEAKLDLICRKLGLEPGMRLLDIGCGWGGLVRYAAEHYGIEAVGITVSREQVALAREHCAGLPVEIRLADYREVKEPFDRIASVGMVEHVGWRNYRAFMDTARRCLNSGGLFLLHTIGSNRSVRVTDPWIGKYIFPNSHLPSLAQLTRAAEGLFQIEDVHSFGPDYDRTLMAWHANFERGWPGIAAKYGERFYRMWRYYLLSCAAAFRVRRIQLWQLLLSVPGRRKVPQTIR